MRLAIIGSGSVSQSHIQAAQKVGFFVSSIASSDYSKTALSLSKKYNIPNYYENVEQLLNSDKYDCVALLTQPEVTQLLLPYLNFKNIPVLVEKPVALSSAFLKEFEYNTKIFVGYNRRFYQTINELNRIKMLSPGILTFSVIESLNHNLPINLGLENVIMKNTVHFFDLLNFLVPNFKLYDFVYSNYNYNCNWRIYSSNKFIGSFNLAFDSFKNSYIEFENNQINICLKPIEKFYRYDMMRILQPNRGFSYKRYEPSNSLGKTKSIIVESGPFKPGFIAQYQEFFNFCEMDSQTYKLANLKDARIALESAESVLKMILKALN
jgi:predicted dehydrogenase